MSLAMRRRELLAASMASAGLVACGSMHPTNQPSSVIPLPVLDLAVPLRVVYAHNPRFERPAPLLLAEVVARTQALCKLHLRLDVLLGPVQEQGLGSLFQGITPADWRIMGAIVYDFRRAKPDRKRLVDDMKKVLAHNKSPIADQIAFARPHLVGTVAPVNASTLAEALIDTQLARFAAWQKLKAVDGQDLLNQDIYNEFFAWVMAPRKQAWPFEVVLTNQLIVGVEYLENSLHSALRGGVSNGITTQSPAARYGMVSVCSLFPMTSMDPITRQLRGDTPGQDPKAVEAIATLLTHELGHQLLHLGHPFNHKTCVMNPAELLQFDAWTRGLDAAQCPIGNVPENKPGTLRFSKVP